MPLPTTLHPDAITLTSFALGRLSEADSLPIEEHVAQCATCRELIESAPNDSLVARVQTVAITHCATPGRRVVDGYEIGDELGRGGMGIVYRARQIGLNRPVALKMLRDGLATNAGDRARFRAEAEAISRLRHPNIVQIYEIGECHGQPFLALEFIDGGALNQFLDGQPLPPRQAASLVATLARAVHSAHTLGVVHRDLKPANVLLANAAHDAAGARPEHTPARSHRPVADLQPKITDFGLAKFLDSPDGPTRTGEILGTPSYMAPEQIGGQPHTVGPATDVYALGAILYECLTGRPPFRAATALETLEQVRTKEPVALRALQPGVPRDLETIALKCLRKDCGQRYASSAEFADDLGRWQAGEPIRARPAGPAERLLKWVRRRPTAAALVMVGLLGVGLAIAGALIHTARLAAEIGRTEQQKQRAVAHYREARETLRRLLARGEPANWRPTTHPSEIYLAQIEEALTFYRSALQSDGTDPEVTRDMANAHLTAATAQSLRGESHRAKANLQSACALLEPLHASDPDDLLTCRFLAICYNALALTEPSPDAAIELRRKTLALCDRLMEVDVVDPYRARAVAEAVHNLGASLQAAGRLAEAETQYVRAIALWRDIRGASTDIYTTMSLAESQINLAVLLQQLPGRVDEVLTLYRNADGLLLPIVDDRTQGVEVATSLAIAYLNWSNVYSFTGRSSEATELLTRAIALLDKALVREPKWASARENRAKVYGGRAQLYANRGQFKEALADWDRAAADATSADTRKTVHLFRAGVLIRLGDHAAAAGAAAELADSPNLTGADQYNLACTFALCIPPALADRSFEEAERSRRADDYAQQALRRLEAAREAGYFRDPRAVSHLAADADLEPLHFRPGWREFELTLPNGSPPKGRSSSDG